MTIFMLGLFFTGLTFIAISLQKTYAHIPVKELKRRAKAGDELARLLYRAVGYGASLRLLLWIAIGLSAAVMFYIWSSYAPTTAALIISGVIIWVGFAWLPNSRVSAAGVGLARILTPLIDLTLNYLSKPLDQIYKTFNKFRPVYVHSGLYEKEDFIALLKQQSKQPDNRISEQELQIISHALTFSDTVVREVMVPRRVVKVVSAADQVGPLFMDELHKSGYSRFPVFQDNEDSIVGTLYLRDLVKNKAGGSVSEHMSKDVYYVHDEQPLGHVLQAFLKTKHHLFIVVNSFEEVVGIITIEDVLEQIIGKQIVDEFDKYDNMRAVAEKHASKQHASLAKHEPATTIHEAKVVESK